MPRFERTMLARRLRLCHACGLCKTGKGPVAGIGPSEAPVVLVGRNPGRSEDAQREPFVGRSGQWVVATLLAACGLERKDVGILNRVSCWTPGDRVPEKLELDACEEWAWEQLLFFDDPRVVVTLGREARDWLLPELRELPMAETEIREPWPMLAKTKAVVISLRHPSYFLRNQTEGKWFEKFRLPIIAAFVRRMVAEAST